MTPAYDRNASLARSFVDAFNRRDVDDFVSLLADDVELRMPRGIRRGRREATEWFSKPFDHLDLRFELTRFIASDDSVIAFGHLVLTWKESGEVAERVERAAVWTVDDGLIRAWQPFDTAAEALSAAGLLPGVG